MTGELISLFDQNTSPATLASGQPAGATLPAPAGWPAAPDQAAYHGLPGAIVAKIAPNTEADPVAILAQLLVACGALIGPDLREVEYQVEQEDVPQRGAARADMAEDPGIRPREVLRADSCHGAGPARGDERRVHDGQRDPGGRIQQGQQAQLAWQARQVVADEVADNLEDPLTPAAPGSARWPRNTLK